MSAAGTTRTFRNVRYSVLEPEIAEHVHRVGADLDAGPDFAELWRLLVDLHVVTSLHQARCCGKSAKTRAGDKDFLWDHFFCFSVPSGRLRSGGFLRNRGVGQALTMSYIAGMTAWRPARKSGVSMSSIPGAIRCATSCHKSVGAAIG
jgi:hypothetical protein